MDNLINHPGIIAAFSVVVIIMLLLDLGVFNKKSHIISNKEAAIWSLVWIGISMIFSIFIYIITNETAGLEKFAQYQTAYWIEKALSVDNLFVFILVFGFFNVPREYQHKVLFWGIIGALVMRAIFIFSGVGLINVTYLPEMKIFGKVVSINVVLTLFGAFLIYAGIKSWFAGVDDDDEKDFSKSPGAKFIYKLFKVSKEFDKDKFFTIENGIKVATPLLVVVGVIEFTDLLFAVDSIPAIFAIAPDIQHICNFGLTVIVLSTCKLHSHVQSFKVWPCNNLGFYWFENGYSTIFPYHITPFTSSCWRCFDPFNCSLYSIPN